MEAEQERVRSLFMDTVMLLCKNNLRYETHLTIEGLVGIKVDTNDVLFVHISEKFEKQGHEIPVGVEASNDDGMNVDTSHQNSNRENEIVHCDTMNPESRNSCERDMEQHIQERNKVEGLFASQRKVPRKPSSPQRSLSAVTYPASVSDSSSPQLVQRDVTTPAEFQNRANENENYNIYDNNNLKQEQFVAGMAQQNLNDAKRLKENVVRSKSATPVNDGSTVQQQDSQTPWPNVAGNLVQQNESGQYLAQLDLNAVANTTTTNTNTTLVQPGCSTWTNPAQTTQLQTDTVVSPAPFLLAKTSQSLTILPPSISPSSSETKTNLSITSKRRRNHSTTTVSRQLKKWDGRTFFCDFCRYQSKRLWNLQRHIRKHTSPPVRCVLCRDETYFGSDADLQEHTELVHKSVTPLEERLKSYRTQDNKELSTNSPTNRD